MIRSGVLLPLLALAGCMATAEPPPGAQRDAIGIEVVAGTYGGNCKAPDGNKTDDLRQACAGKQSCTYRVDVQLIGDPVYGCAKDYVAAWRCGPDPAVRKAAAPPEAGYGSTV